MFKNYLKITFAVMRRRKFYTFISLFGISLTLTVLLVITAFFDNLFAPNYPEINRERMLYTSRIEMKDTIKGFSSMNPLSYYFIENYIATLKTPEKVSAVGNLNLNTYLNEQKADLRIKYTDVHFWEMTGFEFLEGKAFNAETIKGNDNAIVMNSDIRDKYFGKDVSVTGKTVTIGNDLFHIVGVVRGCPEMQGHFVVGDIYMPYTLDKNLKDNKTFNGRYDALILAKNKADLEKIKTEFAEVLPKISLPKDGDFAPQLIYVRPETAINSFIYNIAGRGEESGKTLFITVLTCFAILFMSLPALNLVNINISRIMERASEIGIRKAFGASASTLTVQFIIENIILTIMGGALALIFSGLVIAYLNRTGIGDFDYLMLKINWTVAIMAFILSLVFGLLSGVYPAWRMAKLSVVDALKA
jgi:putative ABC transport system permease protein